MTPQQIALARHALGLPNKHRQSFRNWFVTSDGCADFLEWEAMVKDGLARRRGPMEVFGGDYLYHLNRSGADAALKDGESLSREDWP